MLPLLSDFYLSPSPVIVWMKGGQLGSSFYPDNNVNVMHDIDRVTLCDLK